MPVKIFSASNEISCKSHLPLDYFWSTFLTASSFYKVYLTIVICWIECIVYTSLIPFSMGGGGGGVGRG